MAALETKHEQTTLSADQAVFVARDGRRARRLRNAAVVAGVLAILWIVGLAVGMLGFGSLPGVGLVKGVASHARPAAAAALPAADKDVSRVLAADDNAARHVVRASTIDRAASVAAGQRSATRNRSHRQAATRRAANAQDPVNLSRRTRGWSRKGYAAPRGQLRRAAPPPPPVTSRGRRVGRQKPLPAPPPAIPPGQSKKAAQPPPPPPPPPKKG